MRSGGHASVEYDEGTCNVAGCRKEQGSGISGLIDWVRAGLSAACECRWFIIDYDLDVASRAGAHRISYVRIWLGETLAHHARSTHTPLP
jgi:hypothetical protein